MMEKNGLCSLVIVVCRTGGGVGGGLGCGVDGGGGGSGCGQVQLVWYRLMCVGEAVGDETEEENYEKTKKKIKEKGTIKEGNEAEKEERQEMTTKM